MKLSIAAILGCVSLASALIPDSTYNYEEYVETFKKKARSVNGKGDRPAGCVNLPCLRMTDIEKPVGYKY